MSWAVSRVLRDRNACLYLAGVVVSGFGTSAMALVSGVWVKSLTGSNSLAALTGVCLWLPTLFGPVIGVAADRVRRRTLLVRTNLAMGVVLLALLTVRSEAQVWVVFAVMTLYGVSGVLLDAAEAGLVGTTVRAELRGEFNGLRMSANEGTKLLAPLVGAGLFVRFGGHGVVLLDAVTFAAAAGVFALVRVGEEPRGPADRPHWLHETREGVRGLRQRPAPRRLVVAGAATMAAAGLNGAAIYAVADQGLHQEPAFVGVLYAVQGVGSVAAGLVAGTALRGLREGMFAAVGSAVFAVGIALRAVPSLELALAGSALIGLGLPCVLIAAMTAVQRETPEALIGRVAATASTLMFAPNALTAAAGAGLIAAVDHRLVLAAASLTALAAAAYAARARAVPPAETPGPDKSEAPTAP
ncbi:MFS transporter [Yinghuangia sp. YIM S09857]|uniref:MFS transporter n=1 Tax=Yinghuangia sp. YIM S09857 TaxID=3436929 RepID=UPI003F52DA8C